MNDKCVVIVNVSHHHADLITYDPVGGK